MPVPVQVKAWPDAVVTALRLGDKERVEQAVLSCGQSLDADGLLQKQQLAYILAQQVCAVSTCSGPPPVLLLLLVLQSGSSVVRKEAAASQCRRVAWLQGQLCRAIQGMFCF